MKFLVILLLSAVVATSYAMKVQKRQVQSVNPPAMPVAAVSQPVVNNVAVAGNAAPVASANANDVADPDASDIVNVNPNSAQVQAVAVPSSDAVAVPNSDAVAALATDPAPETDAAAIAAPTSAVQNAAVPQKSNSLVAAAPNLGDNFFYDPMEMMYDMQDGAYNPAYDRAYDPVYDPAYDPAYEAFNNPYEANDAANHTCSAIQVAFLNNVFYFTRASTLIASVESLLQYEEQLFNSASFQKMLSNPQGEYEYISLGPKTTQPTAA